MSVRCGSAWKPRSPVSLAKTPLWGRGVRVRVERDDAGTPRRVWLWRALVGAQRTDREGFSGRQRPFRA